MTPTPACLLVLVTLVGVQVDDNPPVISGTTRTVELSDLPCELAVAVIDAKRYRATGLPKTYALIDAPTPQMKPDLDAVGKTEIIDGN